MNRLLCLVLCLLCLLPGCAAKKDLPSSPEEVKIISQDGSEHTPLYNWIYSYENGLAADGTLYGPDHMIEELLDSAPVHVPFTTNLDGEEQYSVYDMQGKELSYRTDELQLPAASGEYICVISASFGTKKNYQGYQLYFKFTV